MAMLPMEAAPTQANPTNLAVIKASKQSSRPRCEVAAEAGLSDRQLRRIMNGEPTTAEQCAAIMRAYGMSPTTGMMLAELGYIDLIGTDEHDFLEAFIPRLVALLSSRPRTLKCAWADYTARFIDDRLFRLGSMSDDQLVQRIFNAS